MKRWQAYLIVLGLLSLFLIIIVTESQRDTPTRRHIREEFIKPFVEAEIYGVITKVRRTDKDLKNVLSGRRSQEFYYFDLNENWEKHFDTGLNEPIQVGDTIRKDKGANRFSLTRKGRGMFYISYPIDSKML